MLSNFFRSRMTFVSWVMQVQVNSLFKNPDLSKYNLILGDVKILFLLKYQFTLTVTLQWFNEGSMTFVGHPYNIWSCYWK